MCVVEEAGLNGTVMWDICHYTANTMERALRAAGLWGLCTELVVVLNLSLGPYRGSAWFQTVKDAQLDYFATTDIDCSLFCSSMTKPRPALARPLRAATAVTSTSR